jgi:hypothetical protein
MPDPLLFVLGVFVTAVVGLAVWSIGLMDIDNNAGQGPDRRGSREGGGR